MIRIVLLGRTGNNLFQYAIGRVLAEKHGVPLVLDGSWYNQEGWREVSRFLSLPIRAKVVRPFSLVCRALRKATGKHRWEYRNIPFLRESETDQSYAASFLDAPADCVLFGYFQSPLYFQTIGENLRTELVGLLRIPPSCAPTEVAVHVRRGDYLKHPVFAVCDASYYHAAMEEMRRRVPGAHFRIYSDDPIWCRETFSNADSEVIDSGEDAADPLCDLRKMASASHHVISNSTYSWWAAWLANHPNQQVIMPDRWYATDEIIAPVSEKRLPGWETIATRP